MDARNDSIGSSAFDDSSGESSGSSSSRRSTRPVDAIPIRPGVIPIPVRVRVIPIAIRLGVDMHSRSKCSCFLGGVRDLDREAHANHRLGQPHFREPDLQWHGSRRLRQHTASRSIRTGRSSRRDTKRRVRRHAREQRSHQMIELPPSQIAWGDWRRHTAPDAGGSSEDVLDIPAQISTRA